MDQLQSVLVNLDKKKAIRFLQDIIRHNTTNPPGNELKLAEYICDYLKSKGINNTHVDNLGHDRGNVIARIRGNQKKRALLYNGHLDVVPPGNSNWKYNPFLGVVTEGKIYGRGASDMKSGLAAMIMAAELVAQSELSLKGDLLFTGVAGEETNSLGAASLVDKGYLQDVGAAVIAEPSNLEIFSATKGVLWLKFQTKGRAAHGSMPDFGNNAILQMQTLLNKLSDMEFKELSHSLLGKPTMSISTIQGGITTNVVPDSCLLTVDIRTIPGQNHQQIVSSFEKMIRILTQTNHTFDCELSIISSRPPVTTPPDAPLIQQAVTTAKKVLGKELVPCGVTYYTDAAIFISALDIPMFLFGPGNEKIAHQPDEYVEIDKYLQAIKFYTAFILDYLT